MLRLHQAASSAASASARAMRLVAGLARRRARPTIDGPEDVVQHRAGEQRDEPGDAVPADVRRRAA